MGPDLATQQPHKAQDDLNHIKGEIAKIWLFLKSTSNKDNEGHNEDLNELRRENQALRSTVHSLKERYDKLQRRDSLSLALQIMSKELYNNKPAPQNREETAEIVQNPSPPEDSREADTSWKTVGSIKKKQSKKSGEKSKAKPAASLSDQHTQDHQPREQEQQRTRKPERKRTITIAGDSKIKYVQGWKMSKKHRVKVNAFPGATIEDTADYIKPILRKKPEELVLHVGTNDLTTSEPRQVAEALVDLASTASIEYPDIKISISSLITCNDDPKLKEKVPIVNKVLHQFCNQNKWDYIHNSIIKCRNLNAGGLHLTADGTKLLAQNFIQHINTNN